jgi:hypothetical protein
MNREEQLEGCADVDIQDLVSTQYIDSRSESITNLCPLILSSHKVESQINLKSMVVKRPSSVSYREKGIDHSRTNKYSLQCIEKCFKKYLLTLKLTRSHAASIMRETQSGPTGCP